MPFRFLILSCALLLAIGIDAAPYTLQQCIDTALVNNLSVRQQANRLASQRLAYKQSKANISPSVYGDIGQSWGFGRSTGADNISRIQNSSQTSFNLSANLTLFDGLAMKFNIDEAAANMQASEADLQAQQLKIKMNITTMFLQVLLCRQLTEVAAMQLEDTQVKLRRDSALVAAQRLAAGELYTLQAQVAKEQLALVQQQNELRLALLDLAQAIDIQDVASFDIAVSDADTLLLLPLSAQEVYDAALTYRPEIAALEYTIAAQEAALKSAKAAYSPTLSAGASVGSGYYNMQGSDNDSFAAQMNDNFKASVGISLSVPLYDRMQTTTRMRQQRLAVDNAKLQLAQQKQDLRKEIDQAYYNALSAQLEEQSAMEAERSAAEALRYAEQKQDAGRASAYEYREAKNTYAQALATRLQARYNLLFRIRILHYYQGTL
ncbi:MAG: TolC family protein [Paludibacteraceae bacterium]